MSKFKGTRRSQREKTFSPKVISLSQVKKNRQQVEEDVSKLHNRIRMLQMEEEKALKKIEETRKKAKQLLEGRSSMDKKVRREDKRENPEKLIEKKYELRKGVLEKLEQLHKQKQNDVQIMKKEKQEIKKKKN